MNKDTSMDINRKLLEHEFALDKLTEAIEHVAENSKASNNKLERIAESIGKQELILEKISNMDEKYAGNIARLHKRMDEVEQEKKSRDETGCVAMKTEKIKRESLEERVKKLEDSRTWLVRAILGKLIVIMLGALVFIGGGK